MIAAARRVYRWVPLGLVPAFWAASCPATPDSAALRWVGTWATAPRYEEAAKDQAALPGATLRQFVRVSVGGRFDAVIDFDVALRDPHNPSHLAAAFDSGDHFHPSLAGYVEIARVVDLNLFALPAEAGVAPQQ